MTEQPPFTNRLIHEKSPYLLQHAHNPVDWYPWGKEAFDAATTQDKPIFLSIGYATCHWCHVMEKESFTSPEIARLMNETFINIKVDREELPEVDNLYMEFAQALMSTSGGWPLNLILTPDLKPFFAATYLPPFNRKGLMGMPQFIQQMRQLWRGEEREQLENQAAKLVHVFQQSIQSKGSEIPSQEEVLLAVESLYELIDPVYGGLKGDLKFPFGYPSSLLLAHAQLTGDSRALFCVEITLDHMARGGIFDHLGGGFSRYAIDEKWMIPHFEKMLYDNAILAAAYLDAFQFTQKKEYAEVARKTLDYLLREMSHPEGGFYSAEDADTEGHEGLFYTWTHDEICQCLPKEEAELFCLFYGVNREGNFEGRSVLYARQSLSEFASLHRRTPEEVEALLEKSSKRLFEERLLRSRPFKDDKIVSAWNGLAIDALVKGAFLLEQPSYGQAAERAAAFIETHLVKEGHLFRRWRDGEPRFAGGLDDYAFYIKGLLSLFEGGYGTKWLKRALDLTALLEQEFKESQGAFYYTSQQAFVPLRRCEYYDGAEPSGNAVHAENLFRLYQLTLNPHFLTQAEEIFKATKHYIDHYPPGACYHLLSLQRYYNQKAKTIVIALDQEKTLAPLIRETLRKTPSIHRAVIWKEHQDPLLSELIPSLVDKNLVDGQTAVYVCRQDRCGAPLIDEEEIKGGLL